MSLFIAYKRGVASIGEKVQPKFRKKRHNFLQSQRSEEHRLTKAKATSSFFNKEQNVKTL